jgi:hypothetical protein
MPRPQAKPTKQRHDPLHVELEQDDSLRRFGRVKNHSKRRAQVDEDDENPQGVRLSRLLCPSQLTPRPVKMRG